MQTIFYTAATIGLSLAQLSQVALCSDDWELANDGNLMSTTVKA